MYIQSIKITAVVTQDEMAHKLRKLPISLECLHPENRGH
jgi:hypothetical protein